MIDVPAKIVSPETTVINFFLENPKESVCEKELRKEKKKSMRAIFFKTN